MHPIPEWLSANYGISLDGIETGLTLAADDNDLYVVTQRQSIPPVTGCYNCMSQLEPTGRFAAHILVLPFDYVRPSIETAYDLNGDQAVTAVDALIVINALNSDGGLPLADRLQLRTSRPGIDVNGDGELTAADALAVINYLNAHHTAGTKTVWQPLKERRPIAPPTTIGRCYRPTPIFRN